MRLSTTKMGSQQIVDTATIMGREIFADFFLQLIVCFSLLTSLINRENQSSNQKLSLKKTSIKPKFGLVKN